MNNCRSNRYITVVTNWSDIWKYLKDLFLWWKNAKADIKPLLFKSSAK